MLLNVCVGVFGASRRVSWALVLMELNQGLLTGKKESSENLTLGQPTLNWPHGEELDALTEKSIYFMIHDAY